MFDCMPDDVQKLIGELRSDDNSELQPDLPPALDHGWDELKAAANGGWLRWKAWVRAQLREGQIQLDENHRRVSPPNWTTPPTYSEAHTNALGNYQGAVLLIPADESGEIDERCFMDANRILLSGCTVHVLPGYSARMESEAWTHQRGGEWYKLRLDAHEWDKATSYVVDYRLILGDAIMFAFRPRSPEDREVMDAYGFSSSGRTRWAARVQTIDARLLFEQRLKNYAQNIARELATTGVDVQILGDSDVAGGGASVVNGDEVAPGVANYEPDLREPLRRAVDGKREIVLQNLPPDIDREVAEITFDWFAAVGAEGSVEELRDRLDRFAPRDDAWSVVAVRKVIVVLKRLFSEAWRGSDN